MWGRLVSALAARSASPLAETPASDHSESLALGALLVRIARADGDYSNEEAACIDRLLVARYGLGPFEAAARRRDAEALEAAAADTVRFTRALKETVPHEDRLAVIEALWHIALADGGRDAAEDSVLRLAANLLGISDRDSALARQRVAKGL
ncbi:MAG: TerB family tellurite resistance protein [Rhodobacteraceae bacterium]|nr:TerB family tellurite resistance protein [Paracoccaceae bacterium]